MHLCSVIAKCLKLFFFTFLALSHISLSAAVRYEITPEIEAIYQDIWEMNFEQADIAVANVLIEDPDNFMVLLMADYIDFSKIFVADDLSYINEYIADVDERISKISDNECASPYFYFVRAELYLHRALARTKNGSNIKAGWDINRANKLLNQCKKEYPDFRHVDKSLSVIHALMGSIKGVQKTFIKLLTSLDGSIEQGIDEIESLSKWNTHHHSLWSNEIVMVHALMLGHIQKDWTSALQVIHEIDEVKKKTPLGRFLIATTAIRAGQNETALTWLLLEANNEKFQYLEYLLGDALLYKGDQNATRHFQRFLSNHKGQSFLKAAHQKMAWASLIFNNDQVAYEKSMQKILTLGNTQTGADQQAQFAAETKSMPNTVLLQARLFYDGGYFEEALSLLKNFDLNSRAKLEKIEYHYRIARVYEKLSEIEKSIGHYEQAVKEGKDDKRYYACNSALQLAHIYFKKNSFIRAREYIDQALKMKPSERRSDLHQEARLLKDRMSQ